MKNISSSLNAHVTRAAIATMLFLTNVKTLLPTLALLSVVLAGCSKQPPREKVDACQLLTSQEIEAVQGSPLKETKGSEQSNGRIRTSQCYFAAEQLSKSVSLTLTQADTGAERNAARTFWEDTFGRYENEDKEKEGKENAADKEKKESLKAQKRGEEEEEGQPPKKIDGVGREAFWSGTRVGGALYVLKKDVYLRISLGGPDEEAVKIDKSKKLAEKALARLP